MGPWFAGLIRTALSPLCWASTTWPQPDPSAATPWWTFLRYDPCNPQQQGTSPPHRRSLMNSTSSLFCHLISAAACFARLCLWPLRFRTAFWVKVLTGSAFVNWLQSSSFGSQEAVINSVRGRRRLVRDLDDRCPSWLVAYIQFIWPSAYVSFPCISSIYVCLLLHPPPLKMDDFSFFFGRGIVSWLGPDDCTVEQKVLVSCTLTKAAKFLLYVWARTIR